LLLEAASRETDATALGRVFLALAELRVPEGIQRAVAGLSHPGEEARALAAEALGIYGEVAREKGLGPLLAVVENDGESEGVRGVAAGELPDIAPDSDEVAKRLLARMGHPSDPLNLAIKVALRRMASRWLVVALIEVLANPKESDRRRFGAWQVLRAISGRDMPQEAGKWAEWWKTAGATFDFPNAAGRTGKDGH
ncbi:MAG: hypothetical protein HY720_21580, partial [Planctomycetes bacterium]|nr:hypothetical protein [Planctomycetota bacterium]